MKLNNSLIIKWFLKKYLPRYKIKIKIQRKLLKDNYGELYIEDYNYRPRSFKIYIDKNLNNKKYITTLLHELWHIYQFVVGKVKIRYNKTYYNNIDVTNIDDKNRLFEIEAEKMEKILLNEIRSIKN